MNYEGLKMMLNVLVCADNTIVFSEYFYDLLDLVMNKPQNLTPADKTVVVEKLATLYDVCGLSYKDTLYNVTRQLWRGQEQG